MAETLLIHFDPASAEQTWSTVNEAGELTSKVTTGPLELAGELAQKLRTVVLLDNTLLHISTISLPAMSQQKLLRAVPFALEEQLADDIEDMHFVFHRQDKAGPVAVAAISRDTLRELLDTLRQAGITPAALVPDCLCLAASDMQWCVLFHDALANFQYGTHVGNEYDRDIFAAVLSAQLAQAEQRPVKLLVFSMEGDATPDTGTVPDDTTEVIRVNYNTHPLVVYCGNTRQAMPLNLLQYEFKPVRAGGIAWRRWAAAAVLAVLWLATSMGVSAWQLHQVKQHKAELVAETVRIYRETFPESKRIVNPRVQMEQKLKELRSGGTATSSSVIALLASSAPALAQEKSVELRSFSYRNGRLDITIDSKNLNSIQSLNTKLNQVEGLRSEIISSSSEKDAVTGSLRIQQADS